jgi:hypothetical protein
MNHILHVIVLGGNLLTCGQRTTQELSYSITCQANEQAAIKGIVRCVLREERSAVRPL